MSGSQYHDQVSLLLLAMQKNSCNSVIAYGSFEHIVIYFSATTVMSSWNQWGVMAAGYCCSWWRWSDTFWVTLTRLWLHLFLLHFFIGLARTDVNVTFKVWLWSFLCHFTDPWLCILQIEQWCRTAYSVIMFGTWCCGTLAFQPAQIAGCKTTIIATPPRKDGSLCPVSSLQFITKNPFQFIQHFVHTNWIINLRILAQPELLIVWRFELQVPLMAKG